MTDKFISRIDKTEPVTSYFTKVVHPKRGAKHHPIAVSFIITYPVGTKISVTKFDEWAEENWLIPPVSDDDKKNKQSDAWKARLYHRHDLLKRINNAASHPRMEPDHTCFQISNDRSGTLTVLCTTKAFFTDATPKKVLSLVNTRRKHLGSLLDPDITRKLPPQIQYWIVDQLIEIENLKQRAELDNRFLTERQNLVRKRIAMAFRDNPDSFSRLSQEQQSMLQLEFDYNNSDVA